MKIINEEFCTAEIGPGCGVGAWPLAWFGDLASRERETLWVNISRVTTSGLFYISETLGKGSLRVVIPLMVGEGVDGLELDGVLRFVHTELTAAFFSDVLKFSYNDTPYWKCKKHIPEHESWDYFLWLNPELWVKITFAIRIPVTQRFMVRASSQHRYLMYWDSFWIWGCCGDKSKWIRLTQPCLSVQHALVTVTLASEVSWHCALLLAAVQTLLRFISTRVLKLPLVVRKLPLEESLNFLPINSFGNI